VVALWRASLPSVILAIAIPEIPRVARLVRSLVLTIREEPYVEAAVALARRRRRSCSATSCPTPSRRFWCRRPTSAPSRSCSRRFFLPGVGLPPDIPTWGNIMAEGRVQFVAYPHNVFFPGIFLAVTVLAVNMLGDGLRDTLDPKMAKRV